MIGSDLHRFAKDARYCPLDFEAESLSLGFARPFQVAYALADNKTMGKVENHYILWDDLNVSEDAARITHFNIDEYRAKARPAKDVLDEFDSVVYDPNVEVIWQNGLGYDWAIHRNWRRACGKPYDDSYMMRSIDLNALSKAVVKGWKPDISSSESFLAWQYRCYDHHEKGLKTNLAYCAQAEGIPYDPSALHDAANDISLMMKVYWKRLYQLDF